MLNFLKKKKEQTIVFDEAYCHSSGLESPKTYQLEKGVADLTFDFGSLESFTKTYIRENPYFPEDALKALQEDNAAFYPQLAQDGNYSFNEAGFSEQMLLNKDTLIAMGAPKFKVFTSGVIALGIYHYGEFRFQVLWATMYESVK